MKCGREIYLLLAFFLVPDFVWAQQLSGRAVRGRSETRARIAGISVYQWRQNTENQVKKALTKIIGNGSGNGLNPFQKRQLTNHQRRLVNRMPSMGGEINLGTYYPTEEGSPIRYRPPNTGKMYSSKRNTVKFAKILPDPVGLDYKNEIIWLVNVGLTDVSLTGWTMKDKAEQVYELEPLIEIGRAPRSLEVRLKNVTTQNGDDFRLNNDGDTIYLIDENGDIQDQMTYTASQVSEGVWISRQSTAFK